MKKICKCLIVVGGLVALSSSCFTWKHAPSAWAAPVAAKKSVKKASNVLLVQGKVKAVTKSPRPGSVPYKDAVIAVHLTGVKPLQGKLAQKEIVVFTWGMRNNRLTPVAALKPGQTAKFQLTVWEKVENRYGGYNRVEFQDERVLALDTYWGEKR